MVFNSLKGLRGGLVVKNPPAKCRRHKEVDFIPVLGRSPGEGIEDSLQYFCLEYPLDRGAWWAIVHKVTKSWT